MQCLSDWNYKKPQYLFHARDYDIHNSLSVIKFQVKIKASPPPFPLRIAVISSERSLSVYYSVGGKSFPSYSPGHCARYYYGKGRRGWLLRFGGKALASFVGGRACERDVKCRLRIRRMWNYQVEMREREKTSYNNKKKNRQCG